MARRPAPEPVLDTGRAAPRAAAPRPWPWWEVVGLPSREVDSRPPRPPESRDGRAAVAGLAGPGAGGGRGPSAGAAAGPFGPECGAARPSPSKPAKGHVIAPPQTDDG